MAQSILPLRVIAEPKLTHRERYLCEIDRSRNRALRYIRADTNPYNADYPTVEIPKQWDSRRLYIRVTLVTVPSEQVCVRCVHPYPIDSAEANVIKDAANNTLYFPISPEELNRGLKSFKICRRKLTQPELRSLETLCLVDQDRRDIQRVDAQHDAKKLIDCYQLGASQLLFSIAELVNDNEYPVIYATTSIYSVVMSAIAPTAPRLVISDERDPALGVKCVPKKGDYSGGDDVLIVIPKLHRKKSFAVFIECPGNEINIPLSVTLVDVKTIAFKTPKCPLPLNSKHGRQIPIVVIQNGEEIARVNFLYQLSGRCPTCDAALFFSSFDDSSVEDDICSSSMSIDDNSLSTYNPGLDCI